MTTSPGWAAAVHSLAAGRVATLVTQGAAFIGFAFGLWILLGLGIEGNGGTGGSDALAYWRAGRAIIDGTALYGQDAGTASAYLYSPLFAQLMTPWRSCRRWSSCGPGAFSRLPAFALPREAGRAPVWPSWSSRR
ncbi:MAG: hypothetical protein HY264_07980 [Chloroflexi bacterium]|nr:hypothetical protein [Chloroflexota bacterium]